MARIAVVGAGVAGLCLAARTAALGHSVTLIEASAVPLDRTSAHAPTWLTLLAPLRDLFLSTGRPLEDYVEFDDVEEACRFHWPDGRTLSLPGAGVRRTTRAVADGLGRTAADQWRALLDVGARAWPAYRAGGRSTASDRAWRTLALDPALRRVAHWRSAPWSAGSLPMLPYLDATFGVHQVRGGAQYVLAALEQRCGELGVEMRMGTRAERVIGARRVVGIEVHDGTRIDCDVAVRATGATHTPLTVVSGTSALDSQGAQHTVWLGADATGDVYVHVPTRVSAADGPAAWTLQSHLADPAAQLRDAWGLHVHTMAPARPNANAQVPPRTSRLLRGLIDVAPHGSPTIATAAMAAHRVAVAIGAP